MIFILNKKNSIIGTIDLRLNITEFIVKGSSIREKVIVREAWYSWSLKRKISKFNIRNWGFCKLKEGNENWLRRG